MKRKGVIITLTDDQAKEFVKLFKKVEDEFEAGRPGSIIAQVEWNYTSQKATVRAAFVDHEVTKKIQEATGVNKK